jgi:hypothetical protein
MYYKGSILTIQQLPEDGRLGDVYFCEREGLVTACVGNPPEWVPMSLKQPEDKLLRILGTLNEDENEEYILKNKIREIIGDL